MQRKSGFPVSNFKIKVPENVMAYPVDPVIPEEESEQHRRRQQLINFGHQQWGFSNWSWTVNKQDLDFVDFANGKYTAGVVAFVSITVKTLDIHRENIGYATSTAATKGSAIYQARKSSVTNALKETLLSFGGSIATEMLDLVETQQTICPPHNQPHNLPQSLPQNLAQNQPPQNQVLKQPLQGEVANAPPETDRENNPNVANRPCEAKRPPAPRHNEEEEARAERKRRQRQAQEDFRVKLMMKQPPHESPELSTSVLDALLADPAPQ